MYYDSRFSSDLETILNTPVWKPVYGLAGDEHPDFSNRIVVFDISPELYRYYEPSILESLNEEGSSICIQDINAFLGYRLFKYYLGEKIETGRCAKEPIHPKYLSYCLTVAIMEGATSLFPHMINTQGKGSKILKMTHSQRLLELSDQVNDDGLTINLSCLTPQERTTLFTQDPSTKLAAVLTAKFYLEKQFYPQTLHQRFYG